MDLTDKLPNEIWVEILDRLPSLKDQLRVQSVSKRFQSCLLNLFNIKPLSLVIHNCNDYFGSVNESPIRRQDQLLDAMQMLANKAKLQSIESIYYPVSFEDHPDTKALEKTLELSFSALVESKNQCLDTVTAFELHNCIPTSQSLFVKLIRKCPNLSSFILGDDIYVTHELNLMSALDGKALTHLELNLDHDFPQEQLVVLLHSLQPNILKNITLNFDCECGRAKLYPVALIDDLRIGAWAALEEIELVVRLVDMQFSVLFDSLSRLPKLRKCCILLYRNIDPDQFASALTSLFSMPIEIRIKSYRSRSSWFEYSRHGCRLVNAIRQVQKHHPMLEIDLDTDNKQSHSILKMSLGHKKLKSHLDLTRCSDNCMECGSLYPILLDELSSKADRHRTQVESHLENGCLYRCKIDKVMHDLNERQRQYKVLSVDLNENVATFSFHKVVYDHNYTAVSSDDFGDDIYMSYGWSSDPYELKFKITVVCGCCLSNGCTKCIYID